MMMVNDGFHNNLVGGWWFQPTPLKNDGVKVSWDDEIPYGKIKAMFQTTNQQKMVFFETNLGNFLEAKQIEHYNVQEGTSCSKSMFEGSSFDLRTQNPENKPTKKKDRSTCTLQKPSISTMKTLI